MDAENDVVNQFVIVSGCSFDVAERYLSVCEYKLDTALNMLFESGHSMEPADLAPCVPGTAAHPSDNVKRKFSTFIDDDDHVRAPIPSKHDVVQDVDQFSVNSVKKRSRCGGGSTFDRFRDFSVETEEQERSIRTSGFISRGNKRLEDLFRPPVELLHVGDLESAKKTAEMRDKWLLVNIQKNEEFSCHVLNRDLWRDDDVQLIVKRHFVLWQVYHDSEDGLKFTQFYNVHMFPFIAIVDPRTGEEVERWIDAVTPTVWVDDLGTFLHKHPKPDDDHKRIEEKTWRNSDPEDEDLKAAIEASLKDSHYSPSKCSAFSPIPSSQDSSSNSSNQLEVRDSPSTVPDGAGNHTSPIRGAKPANCRPGTDLAGTFVSSPRPLSSKVQTPRPQLPGGATSEQPIQDNAFLLIVRSPEGCRHSIRLPGNCQLQDLWSRLRDIGVDKKKHTVSTSYPKKNLACYHDDYTFLQDCGVSRKDTLFVEVNDEL